MGTLWDRYRIWKSCSMYNELSIVSPFVILAMGVLSKIFHMLEWPVLSFFSSSLFWIFMIFYLCILISIIILAVFGKNYYKKFQDESYKKLMKKL